MEEKSQAIDDELYNRQLYVFGHAAQYKMSTSSILLVGLNGLGVETAKNIILAGVKSVTLYDNTPTQWADLSTQFFLNESSLGRPRAASCVAQLSQLNPYVKVSVHTEPIDSAFLSTFTVVVLIDQPHATQLEISDFCHRNNIALVLGDCKGVYGSVFCDFGDAFEVIDTDGEAAASSMVAGISRDVKALVTVLEEMPHNLETGDVVILSDIVGIEALNGKEFRITKKDVYSFEIDFDTSSCGAYVRGGYVNQVKQPRVISFSPLRDSLETPAFCCDVMKMHHAEPLHAAWRALHQYQLDNGRYPRAGNLQDAAAFFELVLARDRAAATTMSENRLFQIGEVPLRDMEEFFKRFALCVAGTVSPICALMGGVVGQEILKACSGKFMPIVQWYYFDAVETLPEEILSEAEVSPLGGRYDGQILVYGKTIQQQLQDLNVFLVGAGAIGCEMLKNWSLMGIATGRGTAHVTDMDQIERSNLSRQFLFRNSDIGQLKSVTAARAVTTMNEAFNTRAYESKVAPETESFFNDDFFDALDIVCAALDNVEARLYLDQRCMFYHKPMLESGTLGAKGNTTVVVPGLTAHYGATRDPPEKSIPLCTVKSFPNQIEHTLQWSREWFEETFKQTPDDANNYITNPQFAANIESQQNTKLDTLTRVQSALVDNLPRGFDDCVLWARGKYEELFVNGIKQLLHMCPLDKMTTSGTLFWSGAKKPPAVVEFDISDALHLEFIVSLASLRAAVYRIPVTEAELDPAALAAVCSRAVLPVFRPSSTTVVATTEEEQKQQQQQLSQMVDIDSEFARLLSKLPPASSLAGLSLKPIDFDKDIDAHMRVVASCGNLRARNYKIPEADLHKCRGVAGKIIPAIATTTAFVTGLSCLELLKLVQKKAADKYVCTYSNLAVPIFTSSQPEGPNYTTTMIKGQEWKWSQWDRIDIDAPHYTLAQLIDHLHTRFDAEVTMMSCGVSILYNNFMSKVKKQERLKMTMSEVVAAVTKKEVPARQKYLVLEVMLTDEENDKELEVPYLRFRLY